MLNKSKVISTLLILGACVVPRSTSAQGGVVDDGLRDVSCVDVEIELKGDTSLVNRRQLQTTAELSLRRNDIAVACPRVAGRLRLEVAVITLDERITGVRPVLYSAVLVMEFSRFITTKVETSIWATIWMRYEIRCCAGNLVRQAIPMTTRDLTEDFTNSVLAARQRS